MSSSLVFKVKRGPAVAVQPARPTPMEVKALSDWDNQAILRYPVSAILFYKQSEKGKQDPAETIKRALGEALVHYYPWAGRLKEGLDGKLVVDCTAEGVVFVEADAEVRLEQFGEDALQPPFPCIGELLYSSNDADAILPLGSPLFTMQVTRLLCGGFVLAFTFDHVVSDVFGAAMFLNAVSELAGGASSLSVLPVWRRGELLNARDPPHTPPSSALDIFHKPAAPPQQLDHGGVGTYRSFFFGAREVAVIRAHLRESCTTFELIVACVVHCRVTSLQHAPDEHVRVVFPVNCRNKFVDPPIPAGYYGNASFPATFVCPMADLHDLSCALDRVKKAKEAVNEGYARSVLDLEVIRRRSPSANHAHGCATYVFSDWSRVGLSTLRFGSWEKPVYAGTPFNGRFRHIGSYMVAFTNAQGDHGRLLNLYMPKYAMEKFSIALRTLLGD